MKRLNLHTIDPAELLPAPAVPESYGPRDEEEQRVYDLVNEALDCGPGITYASIEELIAELRAAIPRQSK